MDAGRVAAVGQHSLQRRSLQLRFGNRDLWISQYLSSSPKWLKWLRDLRDEREPLTVAPQLNRGEQTDKRKLPYKSLLLARLRGTGCLAGCLVWEKDNLHSQILAILEVKGRLSLNAERVNSLPPVKALNWGRPLDYLPNRTNRRDILEKTPREQIPQPSDASDVNSKNKNEQQLFTLRTRP